MQIVPVEHIQRTISLMGEGDPRDTELEIAIGRFAADRFVVKRLVAVVPEAFGLVLLPNVASIILPGAFSALGADGRWREFAFDREPIFADARRLAADIHRDGPRSVFNNLTRRSALVDAVNKALNEGKSLDGAKMSGPALIGVPAEVYEGSVKPKSLWSRLTGS